MAKKSLFWTITSILVLILLYILTTTVILPVATRNPLPEAVMPRQEVKADNNAKKSDKADNTSKKAGDKGAKKTENKIPKKVETDVNVSNSKEDLSNFF